MTHILRTKLGKSRMHILDVDSGTGKPFSTLLVGADFEVHGFNRSLKIVESLTCSHRLSHMRAKDFYTGIILLLAIRPISAKPRSIIFSVIRLLAISFCCEALKISIDRFFLNRHLLVLDV